MAADLLIGAAGPEVAGQQIGRDLRIPGVRGGQRPPEVAGEAWREQRTGNQEHEPDCDHGERMFDVEPPETSEGLAQQRWMGTASRIGPLVRV